MNGLYPWAIATLAAVASTLLPLILWFLDPPFIHNTYGRDYEPFELFTFTVTVALLTGAAIELRRRRPTTLAALAPLIVPLLLMFHFLNLVGEYSFRAWDYNCYESAASALVAGSNPYGDCYLYPPLLADSLARSFQLIQRAAATAGISVSTGQSWNLLFYLYQSAQFFLIGIALMLNIKFARRLGLSALAAVVLVAALFFVNNPLLRTLRHNQVNLWILVLTLTALLAADTAPLLSGLAAAIGAHIKLVPAVLALPWSLTRRWRPLALGAAGLLVVALIEADFGRDWTLWQQFLDALPSFPRGTYYRDNGLHSVVHNFVRLVAGPDTIGRPTFRSLVLIVTLILSATVVIWLVARMWRRELLYRQAATSTSGEKLKYYGQVMDSLAITLIVAPRVWEHHYVLAIPIAIWAAVFYGSERPWHLVASAILMFAVPTFDVFPLSYHRLAGLLLLLYTTPPRLILDSGLPAPFRISTTQAR